MTDQRDVGTEARIGTLAEALGITITPIYVADRGDVRMSPGFVRVHLGDLADLADRIVLGVTGEPNAELAREYRDELAHDFEGTGVPLGTVDELANGGW